MDLTVDVRGVEEVGAFARTLASDQIPFAMSQAINKTGYAFQDAELEHMEDVFTIRRKRFAKYSLYFPRRDRATKRKLEARISLHSPGDRTDIFAKFETDRVKGPFRGRSVAVPTDAVPRTGTGIIRKRWRPSQLFQHARQHGQGRVFKSRGDVYEGAYGTFLIRKPGGRGTIFRRTRDGNVEALYQLVPYVRIQPVLEFVETAQKTVDKVFAANFVRSFDRALRSAR